MFKLLGSRKAQIRGIDFSLAIIIFSLTMGQVLLLTNTFIDGNRSHIDFQERHEFADSTSQQFVFSGGYGYGQGTENWASIPTNSLLPNWNLGLTTLGSIDPFKQARLSNWSLSDYKINYDTAKIGMNLSKDYQIQILNPIDVEITTVSDDDVNTINVGGTISKSSKPLFEAEIWVYVVNSTSDIAQGYGISNSNGGYSINANYSTGLEDRVTNPQFYTIVAIARFGLFSEDAAITTYQRGTPVIPNSGNMSLFEDIGDGYTVNITSEFDSSVDAGSIVALYPGLGSGARNNTKLSMDPRGSSLWNGSIAVPPMNTVVFIVMGTQAGVFTSLAYLNFPVTLDDEISNTLQPSKVKSSTSSSNLISIITRGLLMDIILTVWE